MDSSATMETRRTRRLRGNKPSLEPSGSSSSSRNVSQTPGSLPLNVLSVVLGNHVIQTWYPSLYREELVSGEPVQQLFICDKCFKYTKEVVLHVAHMNSCEYGTTPPGRIVYEEDKYCIYEVDGEEHQLFTQNLSLFAKLFIENKSVCFDVHTFLYYLLVTKPPPPSKSKGKGKTASPKTSPSQTKTGSKRGVDALNREVHQSSGDTEQIVGFFSKEKLSWDNNNLACILVFPPWQRLGLGQFLIKLSYALGQLEGRLGGPERPLSKPGARSYHHYWSRTLAQTILALPNYGKSKSPKKVTVKDLSEETWIAVDDITGSLQQMGVLGQPRSRDGAVRVDKVVLRNWCKEQGVKTEMEHLKGTFYEYEEEEDEGEETEDDDGDT